MSNQNGKQLHTQILGERTCKYINRKVAYNNNPNVDRF